MPITARPEILSPRLNSGGRLFDNENLDLLSKLLDTYFRVPGTNIRFGLDGIVGFIPGIGDILGGAASTIIIVAAWMRGVPYPTIVRMLANLGIEVLIGSVPVLGNLFDIGFRANRRNYALLMQAVGADLPPGFATAGAPPVSPRSSSYSAAGSFNPAGSSYTATGSRTIDALPLQQETPPVAPRRGGSHWLLLAGLCLVLACILVIPVLLFGWLSIHMMHWAFPNGAPWKH